MLSMNVREKRPVTMADFMSQSMMKNNQKKCVKSNNLLSETIQKMFDI
mgnify:CR=1 FL=1